MMPMFTCITCGQKRHRTMATTQRTLANGVICARCNRIVRETRALGGGAHNA